MLVVAVAGQAQAEPLELVVQVAAALVQLLVQPQQQGLQTQVGAVVAAVIQHPTMAVEAQAAPVS
jgi:hypothetical protein